MMPLTALYAQETNQSAPVDKLTSEQLQAREEMAAIKKLTDKMHPRYPVDNSLTKEQKMEIARRSLRAWNLDPLYEPAAYFACQFNLELYGVGVSKSYEASNEVADSFFKVCDKYFDVFGDKTNPQHYYNLHVTLSFAGHEPQLSRRRMKVYANMGVCELAHMELTCSTAHVQLWQNLDGYVLRIPDNEVEQEFIFWKKFYEDKYLPAYKIFQQKKCKSWGEILGCWELIEAIFYARLHNPQEVRSLLQRIADKYPADVTRIWALNKRDTKQTVSGLLEIAGDPQWNTWMPKFADDSEEKRKLQLLNGLTDYTGRFNKRMALDIGSVFPEPLQLPADIVPMPRVKIYSDQDMYVFSPNCVQPCGVINDDWMLYITPILHNVANSDSDFMLCVSRRKPLIDRNSPTCSNLEEAPWPEYPMKLPDSPQKKSNREHRLRAFSYYAQPGLSPDDWTLWVGTRYHGLAKITHESGDKWGGRWFTVMDGLPPRTYISNIYRGIFKGRRGLILHVEYDYSVNSDHAGALFFLDVNTDKLYLIKDGIWRSCQIEFPGRHFFHLPIIFSFINGGHYFSDNHSMNEFADFSKTDIAYLAAHDIAQADISNTKAHYLSFGLGVSRQGRDDKLVIQKDRIELYDKNYNFKTVMETLPFFITNGTSTIGREGILFYPPRPMILGIIEAATPYKDMICIVTNYNKYQNATNRMMRLFFWQPGTKDNPFVDDKWYGPFVWNGCQAISSLLPDDAGYIWMTSIGKENPTIFRIDVEKALDYARKEGRVHSSNELLDLYYRGFDRGQWRESLRLYLANGRREFVLESLEKIIRENSQAKNEDYLDAVMFKAAIFSGSKVNFQDSINCYLKILGETQLPEYQYLATRNLALMYFKCGNYEKSVEMFDKIPPGLIIPQHYRENKGVEICNVLECSMYNDTLKYYSNQARRKLAEQKKKSSTLPK